MGIQGNGVAEESSDNASVVEVRESFLVLMGQVVVSLVTISTFHQQWQPSLSITQWQNPVGLCCRELYHRLYFFVYTCLDLWTSKRVCHPNCDCDLICWRIVWVHSLRGHVAARQHQPVWIALGACELCLPAIASNCSTC